MRAVLTTTSSTEPNVETVEIAVPVPGPGEVQIAMAGASINPVDLATATPAIIGQITPERPERVGLGWDIAGTVSALGDGVTGLQLGQPVIGMNDSFTPELGTQAEYAVLPTSAIAALPADADLIEAATLPVNASTALQALRLAGARPADTVLITGAAGALGGFAVEFAAASGHRVVAVARADDEATVRRFGAADFVVAGEGLQRRLAAALPDGAAVIIDAAELGEEVAPALAAGGTFIAVTGFATPDIPGARVEEILVRADAADLARVVADWRAGRITARVADTAPLEKVAALHERMAAGGVRGRLVLTP